MDTPDYSTAHVMQWKHKNYAQQHCVALCCCCSQPYTTEQTDLIGRGMNGGRQGQKGSLLTQDKDERLQLALI
jgi:hypothetical protein